MVRSVARCRTARRALRSVDQVMEAPELAERGMVQTVEHHKIGLIKIVGSPIKLSKTPTEVRLAPRILGADNDDCDWSK